MNTLSKPLFAGTVRQYYRDRWLSKEEAKYYSQGRYTGEWTGRLTDDLGVKGPLTAEQFIRVMNGQHPITGDQLVAKTDRSYTDKRTGEIKIAAARSGFDSTLSAPKSFSVAALVGGDHRLIEAMRRNAIYAYTVGEEQIQARPGGSVLPETTGKMIMALFEHDTSRPVGDQIPDPQWHMHGVFANITRMADGTWRSIDPQYMYRVQQLVTAVFASENAKSARELGYELEQGKGISYEIKGFTREYLEAVSSRTMEIERLKLEKGLTGREADEFIAKQSRQKKQDWDPDVLLEAHRKKAAEHGMDPQSVVAEAKSRGAALELSPEEANRLANEAITYAKRSLSEREATMPQRDIETYALRFAQGDLQLPEIRKAFTDRFEAGNEFQEVTHFDPHAPGKRFRTAEMVAMEKDALQFVRDGVGAVKPFLPDSFDKQALRDLYQSSDNPAENKTHDQMRVIWGISKSPDRVTVTIGSAGTGKTTSLKAAAEVMEKVADSGYTLYGLTPTSGSTKELRNAFQDKRRAETVQSFLLHGARNQTGPRLYLVDEASLIDTEQLYRLVLKVKDSPFEDRLHLMFDHKQHQSVGPGRIAEELKQGGAETFELNKVVRQKTEEMLKVVQAFQKERSDIGVALLQKSGRITESVNKDERYALVAKKYLAADSNTLVISPDNESIHALNSAVQSERRRVNEVQAEGWRGDVLVNKDTTGEDRTRAFNYERGDVLRYSKANALTGMKAGDYAAVVSVDLRYNQITVRRTDGHEATYDPSKVRGAQAYIKEQRSLSVGDRIQLTNPWKVKGLDNRDLAVITKLDRAGNIEARFDEDKTLHWNLNDMAHVDLGYAMTSYSAQSKTCHTVILHCAAGDSRIRSLMDQTLAYVGVSRGQYEIWLVTDDQEKLAKTFSKRFEQSKALAPEEIAEYALGKHDKTTHTLSPYSMAI